jgi:putative NIF3 family GTP cyclohydrolase 1 type 2
MSVSRKDAPAPWRRRAFLAAFTRTLGTSTLLSVPFATGAAVPRKTPLVPPQEGLTVGGVIDLILKNIPGAPFKETVDTLKAGRADQPVTGIVTTTFATVEVIKEAHTLGANFLIVHEPTYYNHLDQTNWLEGDAVYRHKRDLLDNHGIAVWRFHDYWHAHRPDGVQRGVLTALGWEKYVNPQEEGLLNLPPAPLKEIVAHLKAKLGIRQVRVVGDPNQACRRVVLMPGAAGGRSQIAALRRTEPDLLICGEVAEWETSEYIRDARAMGAQRSLVVLGHAVSEEPGMVWLVPWLQPKLPGIKVTHIPAENPFVFM